MCLLLVNFGLKEFLDNRQLEGKVAFQIIILIGNSVSFLCASTAKKCKQGGIFKDNGMAGLMICFDN